MENKNLKILNYSFLFIIIFFLKINIIYSEENIENESLEWLTSYLKINTVNPPGNESRAVNFYASIFDKEGIEYQFIESAPGRGNIWARIKGGKQPALM